MSPGRTKPGKPGINLKKQTVMRIELKNAQTAINHCNLLAFLAGKDEHEGQEILMQLSRLEGKMHRQTERECNTEISEEESDKFGERIHKAVEKLLPNMTGFFINYDPRGYSLKLKEEAVKELHGKGFYVYTDFGGYGILAPEL